MSKERHNPIGKIAPSFKVKISSLLHASQPSSLSSIDMNISSDNHMSARRYVTKQCCRTLTDIFSSNSGWRWSHLPHSYHGGSDYVNCSPHFSIDTYFSRPIDSTGILGPQGRSHRDNCRSKIERKYRFSQRRKDSHFKLGCRKNHHHIRHRHSCIAPNCRKRQQQGLENL
jgi:hypothetical protein